ncbi:TPA: hypothetical protein ACLA01_002103, partial [Neisseria meningitidis]
MTKRAQKSPIGKSESGFFVMFCSICVLTAGRSVRARFGGRILESDGYLRWQAFVGYKYPTYGLLFVIPAKAGI